MEAPKRVEDLTLADFDLHPVWRFANADEATFGETAVRPVVDLPISDLGGVLFGATVRLANGSGIRAVLGNIDATSRDRTALFLTLEIHRGGQRFHLARYFDFDRDARGPKALAKFLGLPVEEVFPIAYDVTPYAVGEKSALSGFIRAEPAIRLSEEEIIRAAVAIGRI
jgi:hypothetical protein